MFILCQSGYITLGEPQAQPYYMRVSLPRSETFQIRKFIRAKYTVDEPIALLRGRDNSKAKRKNWIFLMDFVLQPIGDKDSGAVRSQVLST